MASQNKSAKTYGNLQAGQIADPDLMRQYLIDSAGLVQVSETDTHVKRLDDALVAGTGIVKTKLGSAADETLQLAVDSAGLRLAEQAAAPTTPATGFAQLYVDTTPALKFKDDGGTVRTLSDTTHTHPTLTLTEQAAAPATPASGFAELFVDTTPALKFKNDAGTVVTVSDTTHTHAASAITSGTLDNARVNWAAPSAIGGTTPAAGTFTDLFSKQSNGNASLFLQQSDSNSNACFIFMQRGTENRWIIFNPDDETGSNAGGNLTFWAYDDSGVYLSTPLKISRPGILTALPTYSKTITSNVRDLQIDSSGVLGYVASARKHKHKIRPIKETNRFIAKLRKLNPVRYRYKVDGDGDGEVDDVLIHYGFVAEEVEQVFPELCSYDIVPDEGAEIIRDENGNLDPSVPTRKEIATLNYSELHALAIAGLQHALDKIDELEAKVKDLERRLVRLEVKA